MERPSTLKTMYKTIVLVAIGGALGSVFRYLTAVLVSRYWTHFFPLGTLITNVVGCLLIGTMIGVLDKNNANNSATIATGQGSIRDMTIYSKPPFFTIFRRVLC